MARYQARKQRRSQGRTMMLLIICLALAGATLFIYTKHWDTPSEINPPVSADNNEFMPSRVSSPTLEPTPSPSLASEQKGDALLNMIDLHLNSTAAILISADGGQTLFEKDAAKRIYPASLVKIMTALVVLDKTTNLKEAVTLRQQIFDDTTVNDASVAGFVPGETVSIEDLLYGLLLPSGGECAIGLADYFAGSEAAFVKLMNEKADELGMGGTRFENSTGLHHPGQYSTVSDIALLLKNAIENKTFYTIFTARRRSVGATNKHPDGMTFYSTLFSKTSGEYGGFRLLGGKTGYTNEAGQCLATLAEADGQQYILVTCGAPGDNHSQMLHIDDAIAVYAALTGQETDSLPAQPGRPGGLPPMSDGDGQTRFPTNQTHP